MLAFQLGKPNFGESIKVIHICCKYICNIILPFMHGLLDDHHSDHLHGK